MSKNVEELSVFISSPEDLSGERALVKQAIDLLSNELKSNRSIQLRVIEWKSDVVPGLGRAQDLINSHIEDCDIYVGIMGAYFGSPTGKFDSGTEEEFKRACARYAETPEKLRVLFYFKTSSQNVFSIDLQQLSKVKAFKDGLQEIALYGSFSTQDELLAHCLMPSKNPGRPAVGWTKVEGNIPRQTRGCTSIRA